MNVLDELRSRFAAVLRDYAPQPAELLDMIRPAQDAKFGDYQANFAMPLGKRLSRPPRDVAAEIVARAKLEDLCETPEVAGPGFINLRLRDAWLSRALAETLADTRLGVPEAVPRRTYIVDFSAPNVAKPMHVGHIRSTVIGDSLCRLLAFLGHHTVGDNHIGDWGTQFGMILYGFRNFRDEQAYKQNSVAELARLYRLVSQLVDYWDLKQALPEKRRLIETLERELAAAKAKPAPAEKKAAKDHASELRRMESRLAERRTEATEQEAKMAHVENDPERSKLAAAHPEIGAAVLAETAKLHAGDAENRRLWREFLPACLEDIDVIYRRLGVRFDETLGESFYHDRLAQVAEDLKQRGLARESDGALCVFLEGHATPFIVRKQDGAFLYATTDLATIQYRMDRWSPDAILYVVDHRQGLHFEQLFATARRWGYEQVELQHISFGTVLGEDGRPFKTRAGDTVGLSGLLDEAVSRALRIVSDNDDSKPGGGELSDAERQHVAEVVGIGALKYADLSQNRTSDYVFSYDKMLAMNGNTATYLQYAYARVRSIFAKGDVDEAALLGSTTPISLTHPAERALAIELLRFPEALTQAAADLRPNHVTSYLFDLANRYSSFFDQCPVLKADSEALRQSRLKLCALTARTLKQGLHLLGIGTVEKM